MGSTDTLTVIGDTAPAATDNLFSNQLAILDVQASLNPPATPPTGSPANYNPPAGFTLLSGLTGLPGSNRVYSLVEAFFNSFTPKQQYLGLLTVETSQGIQQSDGSNLLVHRFSTVSQKAFTPSGAYVPIPNPDDLLGMSMGSVDRNLAVNTQDNTVDLFGPDSLTQHGTIAISYPHPLSDLSETFRPDLAGTALVDVQGNIQSFRGLSANGLVLNDTGNLNLLKTGLLTNSTIVGQPITHIQTPVNPRSNVLLITSTPTIPYLTKRHPLTIVPSLQQIGPLSQPNDSPNP
jgi:hypothetical protein